MTESHFESILDRNPSDWITRLLYADWLEEQGEHVRAKGQRWQAKERKFANSGYYWTDDGSMYYWTDKFWAEKHGIGNQHIHHDVWTLMPCDPEKKLLMHKNYNTRQDAEIALAEGLHRKGVVVEIPASSGKGEVMTEEQIDMIKTAKASLDLFNRIYGNDLPDHLIGPSERLLHVVNQCQHDFKGNLVSLGDVCSICGDEIC
jgi:uncharacterized protein (TIGR02996 family)